MIIEQVETCQTGSACVCLCVISAAMAGSVAGGDRKAAVPVCA